MGTRSQFGRGTHLKYVWYRRTRNAYSPVCDRLRNRSDVNDPGTTHQFDVDGPMPDQVREHTVEETRTVSEINAIRVSQMNFPLLTSDHSPGQTIDIPFTQRD